jgi:glycosyltransferase involved in cell wall biosynthesis
VPRISFIIPAHNEEQYLPGTLAAIRGVIGSLGLDAETIIADDASTDRTPEIARAAGAIVVRHERRQISATRNLGARASTGEILFFVDADTQVNDRVVREAIDAIEHGAVAGGALVDFDGHVPWFARLVVATLLTWMRLLNFCGAACFFTRRGALESIGGWDESVFAGEEILLAKALKKVGHFRLTKARATTSGRKLRTYSLFEMLRFFGRAAIGGQAFLKRRENLGLWYDPRREDPQAPADRARPEPASPPRTLP